MSDLHPLVIAMLQTGRRVRNHNAQAWDVVYTAPNGTVILAGRIDFACPLDELPSAMERIWTAAMQPFLPSSHPPSIIMPETLKQ